MITVYIASPYTTGDQILNVRRSLDVAAALIEVGLAPYCPLLSHFHHFLYPLPYDKWTELDLEWVRRCDALLRLTGESKGADREVEEAIACGIPVYYSIHSLVNDLERIKKLAEETRCRPIRSSMQ